MTLSVSRRRFLQLSAAATGLASVNWPTFGQPAPSDLIVRSAAPLNVEPPLAALAASDITPLQHFYVRNHGPIPQIQAAGHKLRIEGSVRSPREYPLGEISERFAQRTIPATLTCAGNRRQECSAIKTTGGVQWDAGAIGHANWSGALLADLLRAAEIQDGAKHIWFEGLDPITEKDGSVAPFGGSIPIDKALSADVPAIVAHAMNGKPLSPEHGFPVRTVVPGFIGARSVKWLGKIVVSDRPSPNHYVAEAYKIVQSDDKAEAHAKEPIYSYSVNAAICSPTANARLAAGKTTITGYALPSGEPKCQVDRVEVSADGGQSWSRAELLDAARPFSWVRWSISLNLNPGQHQLAVRATDTRGNTMPERFGWNFKGYLYNAWHRVAVQVA